MEIIASIYDKTTHELVTNIIEDVLRIDIIDGEMYIIRLKNNRQVLEKLQFSDIYKITIKK